LIVDYNCHIEGDSLKCIRSQQSKLRVNTYFCLVDALQAKTDNSNVREGNFVELSRFHGNVRKFGKLDLFITFTCNALWPEITTSIHSYETANNISNIVVGIFHAKVEHLLKIIRTKKIFGYVKTYIYT
jgi:hypothetical protein